MSGKDAAEGGTAFALGDLHKVIDSFNQLFQVVWTKSPALGVMIICLIVLGIRKIRLMKGVSTRLPKVVG